MNLVTFLESHDINAEVSTFFTCETWTFILSGTTFFVLGDCIDCSGRPPRIRFPRLVASVSLDPHVLANLIKSDLAFPIHPFL